MMAARVWCVLMCLCLPPMYLSAPAPWRKLEARQSQACGDRLADIMSLVCSGRGYNVAFGPERRSTRRFRRGIVDECCRNSCTPEMLELYCRADPTETPASVQIRKRSDSGDESSEHKLEKAAAEHRGTTSQGNELSTVSQKSTTENKLRTSTTTRKEGEDNTYQLINLLKPLSSKENLRSSLNKITPNDTTEEEFNKLDNIPPMRHKNHHHGSRQLRGKKISMKKKRDKSTTGATFKIGTIKPYFAGRALASTHGHSPALSS